jgi:hypothetical protein
MVEANFTVILQKKMERIKSFETKDIRRMVLDAGCNQMESLSIIQPGENIKSHSCLFTGPAEVVSDGLCILYSEVLTFKQFRNNIASKKHVCGRKPFCLLNEVF